MKKQNKIQIKCTQTKISYPKLFQNVLFTLILTIFNYAVSAQVSSTIDSTTIKIGEQITYYIQVESNTNDLVVFPEGQTFSPLEMIESYNVDTLRNKDKINLIKKYGLTQFDSGKYTIPSQKVIIGDKTFFTDSLKVEVNNVVVDTTQGIYDIKPIISVEKTQSDWWKHLLLALVIITFVAFLLFWFIWRKKPLTEDEKIALLPPYDRAKLALKNLDDRAYLQNQNLKDYYSELTFIIRKYLDEKVYDKALESTTDELITRLNILKEGNQVDLSKEDIVNLESILKRADLVKFAKSAPDIELAKMDRNTIDLEIDHVKEALPEPTEEEKLLDEKYRAQQEIKRKRNKIWLTVGISVFLLASTLVGLSLKYGFTLVKDTIIGHDSKALLESDWVTSAYGFPPITISTPKVLKRTNPGLTEEAAAQVDVSIFTYGSLIDKLNVVVATQEFKNLGNQKIDLQQVIDGTIKNYEAAGAQNIITKTEEFKTPNGAEGLKVYGTLQRPVAGTENLDNGEYIILAFNAKNVVQIVALSWQKGDNYADRIAERILNSVELKPEEE